MSPSQTWLITGCSSGFGEQFVHSLLARGDKVIATGRHAEKRLQHLQSTGAMIVDLDVTGSESVIRDTIDDVLRKEGGDIDVLVNNAGYIGSGPVEEMR